MGATEITETGLVRSAWDRVFSTNDPFVWPFQEGIEGARLFFPTDGYHLSTEQYASVAGAAERVGETGFFLSIVESAEPSFPDRSWGHWSCDSLSYDEYYELDIPLENGLYSRDGSWGVLICHEEHALIGGSSTFLHALDERHPRWTDDLRLLRDYWSERSDEVDWMEPILPRLGPHPEFTK